MYTLKEAKYSRLSELIDEARLLKAFLPSKNDELLFIDRVQKFERCPGYHFFSYLNNDSEIVGFAMILPYKEKDIRSIGPIYVRKSFQGKGLGKKLVQEVVSWAKRQKLKGLFTQTWGENIRSRRVFEQLGFVLQKEIPDKRVNGDSTIHYLLTWSDSES